MSAVQHPFRVAAGISAAALTLALAPAGIARADSPHTATNVPCAQEDSNGCYWDAGARGNGVGRSFYAFNDGHLLYARRLVRIAHRLPECRHREVTHCAQGDAASFTRRGRTFYMETHGRRLTVVEVYR